MSNFLSSPNFRRGAASLSMVATVYAGSVACSGSPESSPRTNNSVAQPHNSGPLATKPPMPCDTIYQPNCEPVDTLPKQQTNTSLSPEAIKQNEAKAAENYTKSPARNERIDALVQSAGQRFITACQTGEAGPCDIYNGGSNQWRSKSHTTQAGWAWLQHSPDYGGKNMQFSATVWVDSNWNVDASKGIKGLSIGDPNGTFSFESPGGDPGVHSKVTINPDSWKTISKPHDQVGVATASESDVYGKSLMDVQIVDETAISLLENFQEMYQLQPVTPPIHK